MEKKVPSLKKTRYKIANSAKGFNYIVNKLTHKKVRRAGGQQYCVNSCYLEFVGQSKHEVSCDKKKFTLRSTTTMKMLSLLLSVSN